jgi:hypothetical protein
VRTPVAGVLWSTIGGLSRQVRDPARSSLKVRSRAG